MHQNGIEQKGNESVPIGFLKNTCYGLALPLIGKRCEWKAGHDSLERILQKHHVIGACIQRYEKGKLADCHAVGFARLGDNKQPVTQSTIFRSASITKMVCALLVFRLQTMGTLNVQQDISELIGYPIRNPHFPDAPITVSMLMSHSSSIVDSPAYFASFQNRSPLSELIQNVQNYLPCIPGTVFRYSNFAAGILGCALEKLTESSLETLAKKVLFEPLGVEATFDASKVDPTRAADSWRVLPAARAFDAEKRINSSDAVVHPEPEKHYLLAAGNLYLTAPDLAKLTLTAWNGGNGFLNKISLQQMNNPLFEWPEKEILIKHGMGLLQINDQHVYPEPLWGHQGFAYGAVHGAFFDAQGNGFVCLNSGASEQRKGHLALVNKDLIKWQMDMQRSNG